MCFICKKHCECIGTRITIVTRLNRRNCKSICSYRSACFTLSSLYRERIGSSIITSRYCKRGSIIVCRATVSPAGFVCKSTRTTCKFKVCISETLRSSSKRNSTSTACAVCGIFYYLLTCSKRYSCCICTYSTRYSFCERCSHC